MRSSGIWPKSAAARSKKVSQSSVPSLIPKAAAYFALISELCGARARPLSILPMFPIPDSKNRPVKESYQEFIKYGFKPGNIQPRVFAGLKLNVNRVLDLTDAKIRKELGFSRDRLTLVCIFACIFACIFSSRSL
jgi:hypothetical protein